jgi:hypothetical protein
MTVASSGSANAERLTRIRERLASSSALEPQLRVMLVLAHEALSRREATRDASAVALTLDKSPASPLAAPPGDYPSLVLRVREKVTATVPAGARVLIVSKGDDELLVPGYDARHFPQAAGGGYAGHYPADGDQAIAHLEQCRAAGGRYIVLPSTAYWWLEYYAGLSRYLLTKGRVLSHDEHCLVVRLPTPAEQGGDA